MDKLRKFLGYHCVYVIYPLDVPNMCKIGISENVEKRLNGIQTGNWHTLKIYEYWWTKGRKLSSRIEQDILKAYRELRYRPENRGEWIAADPQKVAISVQEIAEGRRIELLTKEYFWHMVEDLTHLTWGEFKSKHLTKEFDNGIR